MIFRVEWARDDGEQGSQLFGSEDEAKRAARDVAGTALVVPERGGTPTVFRNGWELEGPESSDAFLKFGHTIQVGVSRPAEPDTDTDPDDLTGSGWRAGYPASYGWRHFQPDKGSGPWVGTYSTPERAVEAAEEARNNDPELAGHPIVRIDR